MYKIDKEFISAYNTFVKNLIKCMFIENKPFNLYKLNIEGKRVYLFRGVRLCAHDGELYYANYCSDNNTVELAVITDIRSVISALMFDKVEYEYCNLASNKYVLNEEDRRKLKCLIDLGFERITEIKYGASIYEVRDTPMLITGNNIKITVVDRKDQKIEIGVSLDFSNITKCRSAVNRIENWYNLKKPAEIKIK